MRLQRVKGSPWYSLLQTQIGMWFRTWHEALMPHRPGQGSTHFWFLQASSEGQSLLKIHSGLQFGGEPIIPDWQVQSHRSPFLLGGLAYGPQGSGLQGSSSTTGAMAEICKNAWKLRIYKCYYLNIIIIILCMLMLNKYRKQYIMKTYVVAFFCMRWRGPQSSL